MIYNDAKDGPELRIMDAQRDQRLCSTDELRAMLRQPFHLAGRSFEPVMSIAARRELRRRGESA